MQMSEQLPVRHFMINTKPRSLHGSTPCFSTLRENSWRVEPGNAGNYMYVGPYVVSFPRENLESLVGGVCLARWVPVGRLAPVVPRVTMEKMEILGCLDQWVR